MGGGASVITEKNLPDMTELQVLVDAPANQFMPNIPIEYQTHQEVLTAKLMDNEDGIFEGTTKAGPNGERIPHGYGRWSAENNVLVYTGEVTDGKAHGNGLMIRHDGNRFQGIWDRGQMKYGRYLYSSHDRYAGHFLNDQRHNLGVYKYKSGDVFSGEWVADKKQGIGIYTFARGERYLGQWYNDQPHGMGTFYFRDGSRYEGGFKHGEFHGKGTEFDRYNRVKFRGEFRDNQRNGMGVFYMRDNSRFHGEYKAGLPDGYGREYAPDGSLVREGHWHRGHLRTSERTGGLNLRQFAGVVTAVHKLRDRVAAKQVQNQANANGGGGLEGANQAPPAAMTEPA